MWKSFSVPALAALGLATASAALPGAAQAQSWSNLPSGSWQESCRVVSSRGGTIQAQCRDMSGRYRQTSIRIRDCGGDLRNIDGRLQCFGGPGGYPGGGFPGGGRNSITVYRDADFRGVSASFRGAIPNLDRSGFNDAISSMRFRGEWVACTDANFRGQCQSFRNDVRNLDRWGMNDRISSLRPAGRY